MRRGFTLIELLIVLAIIGLLASILLPVLSRTRAQARRASCVSQLRQVGLASAIYRQDNDEIPPLLSQLRPTYLGDARLLICPSDSHGGQFAGTDFVEGHKYLASGVSYEYFPRWKLMHDSGLGWYEPSPRFGNGKWDDLTPYVGCAWHWAKKFNTDAPANDSKSEGWELVLTLGGSVRKYRIEATMLTFAPEKYR